MTSAWNMTEDRFTPSQAAWRESVNTISNGYLSTRGSFEERRTNECRATFINGLFVRPPGDLPLLGAVPDWTDFQIRVDATPFDLDEWRPAGYRRTLDLRSGLLTRTVLWRGPETGTVRITFERILSMAQRHVAGLRVRIEALTDQVELEIETGVLSSIPSPEHPAWTPNSASYRADGATLRYCSVDDAHGLTVDFRVDGLDGRMIEDDVHPRFRSSLVLAPGQDISVTKYVSYLAERDQPDSVTLPAPGFDFDSFIEQSRQAWSQRWRRSNVEIGGDPEAELILRYAAFQTIGAASPDDPGAGIGARLMSGFGYRHHVFWDTDIFIAPYLTVTQPDLARTHLRYRAAGLDGARRKAASFGRAGAFYAWEAAGTGDEVTPKWSTPMFGDPVRIWTGEIEEHITADVAWALDHYQRWTGDDDFMREHGVEMMIEGAKYWASRLQREGDGLHLRDVIGPDEYHIHVDDNFYTNVMAAWHLRQGSKVGRWLQALDPDAAARIVPDDQTLGAFEAMADEIVIRQRADGVWEQHEGFFELDEIDLRRFEPRVLSVYDLLGEERIQSTAVIKQADVLMAMALLPGQTGLQEFGDANWSYYAPKADHGSSLSLSFHALLACEMNQPDLGYELFRRAAAIDLEDSMGNGADGIHAACQGGLLQTALFGFAGLHLSDGRPQTEARLPSHWDSIGFSFLHHGQLHDVEVTR